MKPAGTVRDPHVVGAAQSGRGRANIDRRVLSATGLDFPYVGHRDADTGKDVGAGLADLEFSRQNGVAVTDRNAVGCRGCAASGSP